MSIQDHLHKQLIYAYTYMVKCVREQFFINVIDILDNEGKSNPKTYWSLVKNE
jgi:hypothetical protein